MQICISDTSGVDIVGVVELLVAKNPEENSSLPFLLLLPLGGGMVFRVRDTWPRTKAIYCHPVELDEWPDEPEIVVQEPMRDCQRRGAAIDVILTRSRQNRSQIVFTRARGRDMVFWQSPKTRKQARPNVRKPTAGAPGSQELTIVIDTREQYAYRFTDKPVTKLRRSLPSGDYGALVQDRVVAVVERKSSEDLLSSMVNGRLRFALGELATLPRAAIVVEDRYSSILKHNWIRPGVAANGIAELQIRWPTVPIVFCETRSLAEEYVYRFLSAATTWALEESVIEQRLGLTLKPAASTNPAQAGPELPGTPAEIRAWARAAGLPVSDRGRISKDLVAAYVAARIGNQT